MPHYDDAPGRTWFVFNGLLTMAALLAAIVAVWLAADARLIRKDRSRIDQLEGWATKQGAAMHKLRERVLQLERPDEPVYPPRNPGRIGGSPVIPWIEPWSGSAKPIGTEIGSGSPSIGSGGNAPLIGSPTTSH